MNVYLVAQNSSHEIENEYNFLWSPKFNKTGGRNLGYENMKQVRKGDVILHSFDQAIKGVSVAVDDVYSADRPDFLGFDLDEKWNPDGWRVDVSMIPVDFSLRNDRDYYGKDDSQVFQKNGQLNQRYLSVVGEGLLDFFKQKIPQLKRVLDNQEVEERGSWRELKETDFSLNEQASFDVDELSANDLPDYNNDAKAIIGFIGEHAAVKYLKAKYPDAKVKGRSLNLDSKNGDDSLGYDIEVRFNNQEKWFIDVKTTTGKSDMFYLSENEYKTALKLENEEKQNYFILRISKLNKDTLSGDVQKLSVNDLRLEVNSYKAFIN
ncbi:DUF3883 domain-containing protein [Weissella sp. LMG 11983]|uniref:DUF3883 domain-containing protein n=1 Tax=Weissella sp. LMG 11983 TaxID=2987700 RepID=UPI0021F91783|nr:DUF3883 domain-containing protein [Weissella sp. LMG 11983]MCW0927305.1 DUF3883 domain-containing protein [Weissella sp. LMG 11983]